MELLNSIIGFIIAIGILVTFHEYGHFIVARLCNVKVLKFSVGFGKPIYSHVSKSSETEYSLCMIPLGGYVQMLESKNAEGDPSDIKKSDYEFCFDKKSVYQRFAIVAAGPIFNLILAVVFFTMTYLNGIGGIKPKINLENDIYQIISVGGNDVQRWQDVRVEILNNVINNKSVNLSLRSDDNQELTHNVPYLPSILNQEGDIIQNIGLNVVYPDNLPIIGSINNQPNNKNFQIGDRIISVNGIMIESWIDLVKYIQINPNTDISVVVERDNNIFDYTARILDKNGRGFLGISKRIDDSSFILVSYGLSDSLQKAISSTTDYTILTFKMIGRLVTGDANVKNLSGPLSIAQFSGKSLEMGFSYFLYLLAILSVSLGVLNLLPIPMLDGGHLVYYTYEMIFGNELPLKFQMAAQFVGIALLGLIMIIAFYNDFVRIFS
jgi:regulator of sigma E protease|tara:strand:+ start:1069 stop:2379 length:1311 start_codon:yes stop_codon:yes gene_type:complete